MNVRSKFCTDTHPRVRNSVNSIYQTRYYSLFFQFNRTEVTSESQIYCSNFLTLSIVSFIDYRVVSFLRITLEIIVVRTCGPAHTNCHARNE